VGPATSWRREGGVGKLWVALWPEEGDALAAGELSACAWRASSGRRSQPAWGRSGPGPASSGQRGGGGGGGELGLGAPGRSHPRQSREERRKGREAPAGGEMGKEGMGRWFGRAGILRWGAVVWSTRVREATPSRSPATCLRPRGPQSATTRTPSVFRSPAHDQA
jgi:hypothetical protein